MNYSEIRGMARKSMQGNTLALIGATLVVGLILSALAVTLIGTLLLLGVLMAGYYNYTLNIARGTSPKFQDTFSGFNNFGRNCIAGILVSLYTFLWTLLFFIPGLIKSYSYSMTYYLLNDNKELSASEAITESRRLMDGHKWQLFVLRLSFIGWLLLSMLTFGILLIWVGPYMQCAEAQFYDQIKYGVKEEA